jgi:hypothetical protein
VMPWLAVTTRSHRQKRPPPVEQGSRTSCEQSRCTDTLDAGLGAVRSEALRESAHRRVIEVHLAEGRRPTPVALRALPPAASQTGRSCARPIGCGDWSHRCWDDRWTFTFRGERGRLRHGIQKASEEPEGDMTVGAGTHDEHPPSTTRARGGGAN